MKWAGIILCVLYLPMIGFCQKTETDTLLAALDNRLQTIEDIPSKSLDYIDRKYVKLSNDVQKRSEKLLKRMQDKEAKLQRKLQGIDSTKAKELFETSKAKYEELQDKVQGSITKASSKLKEFIPGVDSMNTAMKFLQQSAIKLPNISTDKLQEIQSAAKGIKELQGRLQLANEIQSFIKERESLLKSSLENSVFGKELLSMNKQVYYYQQQLAEYKSILHDPDKMERKALELLNKLPAFQKFMAKNSIVASLFRIPDNYDNPEAIAGIQTRAQIENMIGQRFSGSGFSPQQYVGQQMQTAQAELNKLKDKLYQLGGSSSDMTMPDFKPNTQRNKKLLQRLEYGFNMQSQPGNSFLPVTSDLALTLGYKINDKSTAGIGLSYKMGWGSGLQHIALSSEGIGLRSYMDIKAKGNIWISGGFEYNYLQAFNNYSQIKNLDSWQKSALLGLSKKYKVGKKTGNMQLLYDFLHNKQVPASQGLKFRIGYTFN